MFTGELSGGRELASFGWSSFATFAFYDSLFAAAKAPLACELQPPLIGCQRERIELAAISRY